MKSYNPVNLLMSLPPPSHRSFPSPILSKRIEISFPQPALPFPFLSAQNTARHASQLNRKKLHYFPDSSGTEEPCVCFSSRSPSHNSVTSLRQNQPVWISSCFPGFACVPNSLSDSGSSSSSSPASDSGVGIDAGESAFVVDDLLGPLGENGLGALIGGGVAANRASDLDCDFSGRCCWHNINGGNDDADWALVTRDARINRDKGRRHLGTRFLPRPPFAATGVRATHPLAYAFLVSCPINCQASDGRLQLSRWASPGVSFDVCTLPVDSRNFTFCSSLPRSGDATTDVVIPAQSQPFMVRLNP